MTMQMTASLLLDELQATTNVIVPIHDGIRLTDIEIGTRNDRPIAIFSYSDGRKASLGIGSAIHGITAFVKDGVIVAFARVDENVTRALGFELDDKAALDIAQIQVVPNIERMMARDIAACVGPIVDMAALDAIKRHQDVIPSLTSDELAIARSATWTQADRYAAHAKAAQDRRYAQTRDKVESTRNSNYIPAWGVGAAGAATAPTPGGRVPLGRNARR